MRLDAVAGVAFTSREAASSGQGEGMSNNMLTPSVP
eukprot:CAMPEP_0172817796 /NCGR_PEP_ID=MMETSP1075-20121228/13478_1 /TAXON_ID=2916 /ORGANISM="Ceratium fusus, Strain PA161109" /LENGTH=35 /DNA_ID= /DNA_START= /DNA_END= /DNA_ORIENTATION=